MPRMNGGEALVRSLAAEGLRAVFGVPGAGQYEAIDALYSTPSIRYIAVRHEQAASYMADGYARASGEIAAALVVEGPGLFNALSGVATAYATSSPILVVSGDHHHRKTDLELDETAWLGPLTKWVGRARSPAGIPALVQEAFQQLRSGRPRPVGIEVPPAVFAATEEVSLAQHGGAAPDPANGDPRAIQRAAELLAGARRPVIWAGGGVMRAKAATLVAELADYLQIPVVTTRQGKGSISERHPLSLGMAEMRFQPLRNWLSARDVILAVGTSHYASGEGQQVIRIDVDETEFGGDEMLTIQGDAYAVMLGLNRAVAAAGPSRGDKAEAVQGEVAAINEARFEPSRQLQPQWGFMEAIHAALPADAIVIQGMNQMGYYSRNYFRARAPHSYLTSSSHGTLGCAYPIAVGAKVGCPDRVVVSLSGDGGFLYNVQELSTAVQYGINAVAVVFNDNAYGNVLRAQMEEFDGHVLGTQLHNPDFVALAQSFGAHGVRAEDADALHAALSEAAAAENDKPVLIEVPVGMLDREF